MRANAIRPLMELAATLILALALSQIAAASKRTSSPEEVEQILIAEIKVYQATEKLGEQIDTLANAGEPPRIGIQRTWPRLV